MLRNYQEQQIADIYKAARVHKRILVQSPTGSGKSLIFSHLINNSVSKGNKVLFLTHRRELIYQAERHLKGVNCSFMMAGEEYFASAPVHLGSVDTIRARRHRFDLSKYQLVIIDECHRAGNLTYQNILERVNGAHVLGFTATPIRNGGQPLGNVFEAMVLGPTVQSLIDGGYLASVEYMVPSKLDMSGIKTSGGDWNSGDLGKKVAPTLVGCVVDHYMAYGGKKGIIFSCNMKHSQWLKEEFLSKGRGAVVIDTNTPEDERAEEEKRFREGDEGILINCQIYTEGYDVPDCDTIVLARPTKSVGLYLQMVGRGMRPKEGPLLVIDHGCCVYNLMPIEEDRKWELTSAPFKDPQKKQEFSRKYAPCKTCGALLSGRTCEVCGAEMERTAWAKNVRELRDKKLVIFQKGRKTERKIGEGAWRFLVKEAAYKGRSLGWAVHAFKARHGCLPWEAFNKEVLPRGTEWKMRASAWLESRRG